MYSEQKLSRNQFTGITSKRESCCSSNVGEMALAQLCSIRKGQSLVLMKRRSLSFQVSYLVWTVINIFFKYNKSYALSNKQEKEQGNRYTYFSSQWHRPVLSVQNKILLSVLYYTFNTVCPLRQNNKMLLPVYFGKTKFYCLAIPTTTKKFLSVHND